MAPKDNAFVALRTPRGGETTLVDEGKEESTGESPANSSVGSKGPVSAPTLKDVSLWDLYRFATPLDIALLFVGCIAACINGVLYPCMALVFGHAISAFDPFDADAVNRAAMEYFFIAIALFVSDFFACATFGAMSERQVRVLRETALRHLLHLDLAWYDAHSDSVLQLSSRITGDTVKIKNGMGQKLGDGIKYTAQFLCGYAIGFAQSWDMALVMSCVTPLTVYSMSYLLGMLRTYAARSQQVYAEAGAIAEETLGSMRTVASLNGEHRAVERYDAKTKIVEEANIELFRRAGFVQGIFSSSVWLMYAVGLWYGGRKVYTSKLSPGTVFQAFFGVVMGTWSLGQISPNISAIAEARGAAAGIFTILDTPPNIHPPRSGATVPNSCQGHVSFSEVYFAYPCRPNATVLRNFSVHIAAGQTVAFVGPSGGGKSTIVSLLERFYDPQSGSVLLDGRDIRSLNVKWLRAQIGLVSQEPVLFATTVFENIAIGIPLDRPVVMEDVVAAAKLANAHDFIMHLPQQYDTFVGEKGVSLSGGQKQRIAIARAMARKPKILVLDEATSALDNESERAVQSALNRLMWTRTQMTTLVIAHRLSTIRSADKIVVMLDGCVVEEGSHEELTKLGDGIFQKMLSAQLTDWPATTESGLDDRTAIQLCQEKVAKAADFVSVNTHGAGEEYRRSERPRSKFTMADAMKLSAPETSFYSLGMVAAMIHGLSLPASALLISQVVNVMTDRYAHYQITTDSRFLKQLSVEVQRYGLWYLLVAFIVGCAHWAQVYCFRVMAEKLTARLRRLHFLSLCRQDMAFFDHTKHATGALTSALAIQALKASLVSGDAQGRMVQAATTLATAILVAFLAGSWVLTLVMLSILPFILAGEVIRNKQMKGVLLYSDELSDAGSHASQALSNVRTIKAFGLERQMCNAFSKTLEEPMQKGMRESKINGLAIGYSSFIVFATYASIFWYGGSLVSRGEISFKELIHTLMAIIMASQGVGFAASWLGESAHALKAGTEIFKIRDRPHTIDALRDDEGRRLDHVDGHIEFRHVTFEYPTRPTITVLDKMDLVIGAKQTVGLCGTSGGGKSTIVALIERFYDPAGGLVTLDGHDLKTLNVQWLRRQMGYVGQEPTLFIGTIAENIAYGLDYEPSLEQIERVAKLANAHEFVSNLPDGYATQVGARGELLSGGQKQRIAIARAILREPRVLILDEATSALDSASERVVQAALDAVVAEHRCTTLIIAHRLSTLRYADKICVVDNGRVVEEGPHEELVRLNGVYVNLLRSSDEELEH